MVRTAIGNRCHLILFITDGFNGEKMSGQVRVISPGLGIPLKGILDYCKAVAGGGCGWEYTLKMSARGITRSSGEFHPPPSSPSNRSGRLSRVLSSDCSYRQSSIFLGSPLNRMSGTFSPRQSAGRV